MSPMVSLHAAQAAGSGDAQAGEAGAHRLDDGGGLIVGLVDEHAAGDGLEVVDAREDVLFHLGAQPLDPGQAVGLGRVAQVLEGADPSSSKTSLARLGPRLGTSRRARSSSGNSCLSSSSLAMTPVRRNSSIFLAMPSPMPGSSFQAGQAVTLEHLRPEGSGRFRRPGGKPLP